MKKSSKIFLVSLLVIFSGAKSASQTPVLDEPTKNLFKALYSRDVTNRDNQIFAALEEGAKKNTYNHFGHTPLTLALQNRELHQYVALLATRENVNLPFKQTQHSMYPITLLCRQARSDKQLLGHLKIFVTLGADIHKRCPLNKDTPFMILSLHRWVKESMEYFSAQCKTKTKK